MSDQPVQPDQTVPTTHNIFIDTAVEIAVLKTLMQQVVNGQVDLNRNIEALRTEWCHWAMDAGSASTTREALCKSTVQKQLEERIGQLRRHVYVLYVAVAMVLGVDHTATLLSTWAKVVALFG